jgi:uncharacterized protein
MFKMKKITAMFISWYRACLSPLLGHHCRFFPTCSAYAQDAIERKGVFWGLCLITGRLLRCHPFHPGGYDPLE